MKEKWRLIAICVLGTFGQLEASSEIERNILYSDLPNQVIKKLEKLSFDRNILKVEKIRKQNNLIYEIKINTDEGIVDVVLSPDGKVLAVERITLFSDLSENAKQALKEKYSELIITEIERVQLNLHEIEGTINGIKVELMVYGDGNITIRQGDDGT